MSHAAFVHTQNPSGSFDSICTECFVTVATRPTEAQLPRAESKHECKGFDLGRMHWTEHEQPNRERPGSQPDPQEA
jgi:hypothetical protein